MSSSKDVFNGESMHKEVVDQPTSAVENGDVIDVDLALLRAQGHEAELERSFSWLGATGLAFRYVNGSWKKCKQIDFLLIYNVV